jgi:hypothetical protein
MGVWYIILVFCIVVLAFDGIWSYIAVRYKYNYFRGWWGSYLIYALAGLAATRSGFSSVFVVGVVAFVESSFGTLLANKLGSYDKKIGEQLIRRLPLVVVIQTILGISVGYLIESLAKLV